MSWVPLGHARCGSAATFFGAIRSLFSGTEIEISNREARYTKFIPWYREAKPFILAPFDAN